MILVPPSDINKYTNEMIDGYEHKHYNKTAVWLFGLIYLATLVLVIWYVLENAYLDRNPNAFDDITPCNTR